MGGLCSLSYVDFPVIALDGHCHALERRPGWRSTHHASMVGSISRTRDRPVRNLYPPAEVAIARAGYRLNRPGVCIESGWATRPVAGVPTPNSCRVR